MATKIAKSRRQAIYAVKENAAGTLAFPVAADYIRPAGDGVMNQNPAFTDSKEKADSLDILDQFANALPPGDWNFPMYLRLKDLATKPQGSIVLESALGEYQAGDVVTLNLAADLANSNDELTYDTLAGGVLPPSGIIMVGSEKIRYGGKEETSTTAGKLIRLERGYYGTTAVANVTSGTSCTIKSPCFYPTTEAKTFSLWLRIDFLVLFLSGATCSNMQVSVKNEDAVTMTMKGQGMRMGWAGVSKLTAAAAQGATTITVERGARYSEGARIYNSTSGDYGTVGYEVTDVVVNAATGVGTLTISPGIAEAGGWSADETVEGYLPDPGVLATEPILNRKSSVRFNGIAGALRTTDLTVDSPKSYLSDEVGTEYVSKFVEDMRKVSASVNAYFVEGGEEDFRSSLENVTQYAEIGYGDTEGKTMLMVMPRLRMSSPAINMEPPVVSMQKTATGLGTKGEDSLFFVLL